jgi:hypothetical protein
MVACDFKRLPLLFTSCAVLAGGIAACRSERDDAFTTYLDGREANRTITLEEFGGAADPIADPTLSLMLTNHGSERVTLPDDFAARIFTYSAESTTWAEIRNGATYSPQNVPVVLEPVAEPPLNQQYVGVWAIGEDMRTASHMRVMVSGNLLADDGELGEEVVAYVEIELQH